MESNSQVDVSENFVIRGGVLISYRGNNDNVIIPNDVFCIGKEAFKNNLNIKSIYFSNTVMEIQEGAFMGCKNLETIAGYENIESFGEDCFRSAGLIEINISSKVSALGKYCFSNMPNLKKLIYMPGKDIVLDHTFFNCPKLETVVTDKNYFFPSVHKRIEVKNNPNNKRSTFGDAFCETPFLKKIIKEALESYKKGICFECGGRISKHFFHARCRKCGIDYKN